MLFIFGMETLSEFMFHLVLYRTYCLLLFYSNLYEEFLEDVHEEDVLI